eukprot:XP_011671291.1 PREDICTED: uncharacterized protein LOC105441652 [Strongylocentrotus purpuratus]
MLSLTACLSFALLVSSDASNGTKTCCTDGFSLNYSLPMFHECKKKLHPNGSMVQTIPKLIPISTAGGRFPTRTGTRGIPAGHRVCRFPDCKDVCENGWCEETMKSYKCHCLTGFRGRHCDERAGPAPTADKMTKSTTDPMIMITSQATSTAKSTTDLVIMVTSQATSTTESTTDPMLTMTSQATSTTVDSSCQELSGWFEGSLYCYFTEKKVTFTQAMTNCRNIDNVTGQSDLVSIHSQKEMDFVLSICKDLSQCVLFADAAPVVRRFDAPGGPSNPEGDLQQLVQVVFKLDERIQT